MGKELKINSPIHPNLLKAMDEYYKVENKQRVETFRNFCVKQNHVKVKKKLKILYVTFLKYPNNGGLSNYITSLKTGFEKEGHHVDVISPLQMTTVHLEKRVPEAAAKVKEFLLKRYGVANEKIVKNTSFLNVFHLFLQEKQLEGYDVFHAQDLFALFLLGQINVKYKKPLFFTPHGHFTKSRIKFGKIKVGSIEEVYFSEIEKQGIKTANKIITISNSFHHTLQAYGAKEKQLVTVHTGIHFPKATIGKKTENGKVIISCIARLAPRKGHVFLLRALAKIKPLFPNVDAWIVGDGSMRKTLEKEAKQLHLENVIFFGRRTNVAEILALSSIYVLPTINDNFPLSIIEAMLAGRAIVTTNCGGIPEMIHHRETGLICEPGNVEELAEALTLLLTNEKLREQLGKEAREYAKKHFVQNVMVSGIKDVYREFVL